MAVKWQDLVAGGAGAVDELLFGIPEFVAKKIDRQAVENWIKQNEPAYRTGETAGTIGSMFVPIPGLGAVGAAKGAKAAAGVAKAAKAADVGTDIMRLAKAGDVTADVAKLAKTAGVSGAAKGAKALDVFRDLGTAAKRGAASGALEAGVRGVTSEKDAQQILEDIQRGGAFGAAGGAIGSAIGRSLPRQAGELAKTTERAYLGAIGMKRRPAIQMLKDMSGKYAKGLKMFETADDARKAIVRVGKEIGAEVPGKMDEAIKAHRQLWGVLDDVTQKAVGNVPASALYAEAVKKLDYDKLIKDYSKADVDGMLQEIMKMGSGRSGLANARQGLRDLVTASMQPGTIKTGRDVGLQRLQRELANDILSGVDDQVAEFAKKAGVDIDFQKLKKDYLPMRAIAESAALEDPTALNISMGSQTAEKLAGQELLRAAAPMIGAGALGAAGGAASGGEEVADKLKAAALGAAGGALASKGIGSALTRGLSLGVKPAQLAEKALGKVAPEALERYGAIAGGRAAGALVSQATEAAQPSTPAQAEAAQAGAETGAEEQGTPAYVGRVMDGLARYAASKGVSTEAPEYRQFVQMVYQATGGFQPEAIGGILYQDPEERAAYTRALGVAKQLKEIAPTAIAKGPGFLQQEAPEIGIQRQAAVDQLSALVGDVAKATGTEKAARAELNKILKRNVAPEQKEALIKTLLAAYGVDVDELYSMGVV